MKNNKDVVVITPTFAGGGAEFIAISIANYYYEIGLKVKIICFNKSGPFLNQLNKNIKILNLDSSSPLKILFKLPAFLNSIDNSKVISTVRLSNIYTGLSLYFCTKKNNKFLFLEVNTFTKIFKKRIHKRILWKLLLFFSYKKANKLVACSNDVLNQLKLFIKNKLIYKIGNPSLHPNFRSLRKKTIMHPWINNKKYKVLLNMGRLHEQKNQKFLIQAMPYIVSRDKYVRLIIMGSGQKKKYLEGLKNSLKMSEYIDIIDFQENPYPFLRGSNLFVMSSIYEGFGIVFIMAAACGLRIVSSECDGGPKELFEDSNIGKTYIPDDISDFVNKVFSVLDTQENFTSKRKQVKFFAPYTVTSVANEYLSLLDQT